jgi:inner membrane protein
MATIGHVAVGLAAGRLWGGGSPGRAMTLFSALSLAPDLDVVGFWAGVPYAAPWGHRGASHSLTLALVVGLLGGLWARRRGIAPARVALVVAVVVASHGLLDTLTNGGLGVALGWPWSLRRWFAPWRPIPVAPLGLRLLSPIGLLGLAVETVEFAPLMVWALLPRRARR